MHNHDGTRQLVEVSERDFQEQVLESDLPVLVEFWAPWSPPCKILNSVLSDLATTWSGRAKVVRVNADDSLDLSLLYDIQSVPTLIYFLCGKPCLRIVGTATREAILAKISSVNSETRPGEQQASASGPKN